jgi:hypothetical protein
MQYVAKLAGAAGTVYGYGAADYQAVFEAIKTSRESFRVEPEAGAVLTVYQEYDDGEVEVRYCTTYGRYLHETE